MMKEPKDFARLSAGLLARKGGARPAMRRQPLGSEADSATPNSDDLGWNDMGYDVDPDLNIALPLLSLKPLMRGSVMMRSDDLDHETDAGQDASPLPEVVRQQRQLVGRLAGRSEAPQPRKHSEASETMLEIPPISAKEPLPYSRGTRKKSAPVSKVKAREKAAFTLRLDAERHLRLRLASAVSNCSGQMILTKLLDDYLASLPEIGELASTVAAVPPARIGRKL